MSNLVTLVAAGVVPEDHTLSDDDCLVVENLSPLEVQCLVDLKTKLGDDFLRRNTSDAANFFL